MQLGRCLREKSLILTLIIILFLSFKIFADNEQDIIQKISLAIAKVKPALVRIHLVTVDYYRGREEKEVATGSGVIISSEGYVITNHHVAGNAKRIVCTLANKEEIEAELIGTDPLTDISILRLCPPKKREFPYAKFGDSNLLKVGDRVLAMGSPYALSQSVTMGIVSNTELVIPKLFWPFKFTLEGEDVGSILRWIGHDAEIHCGNSGGPLVNLDGEIVGINEIRFGLSAAIPGNLAKEIAEQLIKQGKVQRSWIGLEVQPLLKSSGQEEGVLVSGTIKDSPAEKAGFLPGDILLEIAGQKVDVKFPEELPVFNKTLFNLPPKEKVMATILRQGKKINLQINPIEREPAQEKTYELRAWGITARSISYLAAKEMRRKNKDGVLVTSIRPGGPADTAKPQIQANDIIVEVDGKPIKNIEELINITNKITAKKDEPVSVLVTLERKQEQYLTIVQLGVKKLKDTGLEARKAYLGVNTQVLTKDMASALNIGDYTGVRITQVYPKSSAEKAGLKVGDIIIKLDGELIPVSAPEDFEVFPTMIRQYKIGSVVELTVIRDKKEMKIQAELEKSPKLAREAKEYRDDKFEFTVRDMTFLDKVQQEWEQSRGGVLVKEVSEGGWAALAHLAVGDIIIKVDEKFVQDVASFEKIMKNIIQKKPKYVVFQVQRGIHNLYIELEPSWEEKIE